MTAVTRYGLLTPGLSLAGPQDIHAQWERDMAPADLIAIAEAADRLGYDHLTCSEHVGIPPEVEAVRGGRYYDPLSTLGFLAARTSRIRLTTYVLVLGYSHPLEICKRYGTLDRLSGGRLVLGLGVGSLKPEFELLGLGGAEFAERGERGDDALRAIRASFAQRLPEYRGPHYNYSGFIVDPCGVQSHVPFWIGGRSRRSLRRAVELGEGWMPFGLGHEELAAMIAWARELPAWAARDKPVDLVLRHEQRIDPMAEPDAAAEVIGKLLALGAAYYSADLKACSRSHYIEQLEALAVLKV
ncbi:MAG: TIGR03619 family F420-dependent LLM class oxidoreductase [Novosphingobium sp.]